MMDLQSIANTIDLRLKRYKYLPYALLVMVFCLFAVHLVNTNFGVGGAEAIETTNESAKKSNTEVTLIVLGLVLIPFYLLCALTVFRGVFLVEKQRATHSNKLVKYFWHIVGIGGSGAFVYAAVSTIIALVKYGQT